MTKKQLKQLAKKIAEYEHTIQTSDDKNAIDFAKDSIVKIQESADLDLDEMVLLDELVRNYLDEKNI